MMWLVLRSDIIFPTYLRNPSMHIKRLSAITTSSAQVSVPVSFSPRKKEIDFQALYKELQKKDLSILVTDMETKNVPLLR